MESFNIIPYPLCSQEFDFLHYEKCRVMAVTTDWIFLVILQIKTQTYTETALQYRSAIWTLAEILESQQTETRITLLLEKMIVKTFSGFSISSNNMPITHFNFINYAPLIHFNFISYARYCNANFFVRQRCNWLTNSPKRGN